MAKLEEKTIFQLLKEQYMVVPEIQREYVWGSKENKEKCKNLLEDIIKNKKGYNAGFLYSYDDYGYNTSKLNKEVYLIDGQQRFTTLYLTLFYLYVKCGKLNGNKEIFKKYSYRVRNLTKEFINVIIDKVKTVEDLHEISNKTWYLSVYRQDPTIKNIINFFTIFNDKSDENFINNLINNLEKIENTKFYYFNTSQTSQGEELYITMNSRGEQIADYEDARVILLEKAKENKIEKSKIFNDIEHFFWIYRKEDEYSADRGFERFLKQIIGLKKLDKIDELENNTIGIVENYDIKKDKINIYNIEIEELVEYYYLLKILFNAINHYKENNYKNYIKSLYKKDKINNNILEKDSFIITILYIIKNIFKIYDKNELYKCDREILENKINEFNDFDNLFKWIRFIYNMKYNYNNNWIVNIIRAIKDCKNINIFESFKNCYNDYNDADLLNYFLSYNGVIGFEADENYNHKNDKFDIVKNEILKIKFLYYISGNNFKNLQKHFWKLEDHPVSSGNINYIIKYALESNKENFIEEFNSYKNIFENCFNLINQKESQKTFIKILLIKAIDLDNNKNLENKWFVESHAIIKGWSNSYVVHLFSLCNNANDWSKSFQYDYYKDKKVVFYGGRLVGYNTNKVYELLFKELKESNIKNIEEYFNKKIEEFINKKTYKNYVKNYFLKIIDENYKLNGNGESILDFSKNKCFAYNRNDYDGIKYILSSDNFRAWHEGYKNFKK